MRNLTRIFPVLVLLLLVTLTCLGQKSQGSKQRAAKPRPRPTPQREEEFPVAVIKVTPEMVAAATPDERRRVGQAGISYFRKQNETTVYAGGEVYREAPVLISLSYYFRVDGKEVVRPEAVEVTAASNIAVFDEGVTMVIEADGKRFDFKPGAVGCFERKCINLRADVDFATFEQLANSRSVTVHAGRYTFNLNAAARGALGDMLRAIESPPKKP